MCRRHLILSACFLLACGDGASTGPGPEAPLLPANTVLRAEAHKLYPDGHEVTCSFRIELQWKEREDLSPVSYRLTGPMGGEAARSVIDAEGAGLAFFADMGWPTSHATVTSPSTVTFQIAPGGSGSPFWDNFSNLPGAKVGNRWSGEWTCLPFGGESGGYMDTTYTAPGTWVIESPFIQDD
ncbi:MAG TPA: hypothetical protein VG817_12350 [Gemmatimonadales bacterium]|nr:hypothetical protein [Gemmatimonadales bacterium]